MFPVLQVFGNDLHAVVPKLMANLLAGIAVGLTVVDMATHHRRGVAGQCLVAFAGIGGTQIVVTIDPVFLDSLTAIAQRVLLRKHDAAHTALRFFWASDMGSVKKPT